MAWTNPTKYPTGTLIDTSIWWTEIVDNLNYLFGGGGSIEQLTATQYIKNLLAGGKYRVAPDKRTIRIHWEDDTWGNYQIHDASGGAGTSNNAVAGIGQHVTGVDRGVVGQIAIFPAPAANGALSVVFNPSRNPYLKFEIAASVATGLDHWIFCGWRRDRAALTLPQIGSGEPFCGVILGAGVWWAATSDGAAHEQSSALTVPINTRQEFEFKILSATQIEFWQNGTLKKTFTTGLVTGDIEMAWYHESLGSGAGMTYLTMGECIMQEDPS